MTIREVFDQFVTALESNQMDLLSEILDTEVEIHSSALGEMKGIKQVKEMLAWKGESLDYAKIRIFNNVIRQKGDFAGQSVFFVIILGKEMNGFMNHFQCAFLNAIEYTCKDGKWKIRKVKSNLTFECGNSMLVAKNWNLIDYSKFDGNDLKLIDTHKNSPWELVDDAEGLTEEEKVMQCFWKYNWIIDTDGFDYLTENLTDNLYVASVGQKCKEDFEEWLREKRFKIVSYKGNKMPKEACWNHISTFKALEIHGNRATAEIYRYEPNRIGTRFIHKYNMNTIYYSLTWHMGFVKDVNGEWKMDSFDTTAGIVEEPNETDQRYF